MIGLGGPRGEGVTPVLLFLDYDLQASQEGEGGSDMERRETLQN